MSTPTPPATSPDNKNSAGAAVKRTRRVPADKVRTLMVDGNAAREAYLVTMLRHLFEMKVARAHSLAFALFPSRTKAAAKAAVYRTLKAAVARKYVARQKHPRSQNMFYALTRKGAQFLEEQRPELGAVTRTDTWLSPELSKAEHREWTSLIHVAANARPGLVGMDEFHIHGTPGAELKDRLMGHVPDALSFQLSTKTVVWHEVDTSRRSMWTQKQRLVECSKAEKWARKRAEELRAEGKVKANGAALTSEDLYRKPRSDTDRFKDLVRKLRATRHLPFNFPGGPGHELEFEFALMVHCGSEQIRRDLVRALYAAFEHDFNTETFIRVVTKGERFELSFESKAATKKFVITLTHIPKLDDVWHDSGHLPWPVVARSVAPSERFMAMNEQFVAT